MKEWKRLSIKLGNLPALIADGRRQPERRQISTRWFAGTFLTGITSCALMGIALMAAFDGYEKLATPPQIIDRDEINETNAANSFFGRGDRISFTLPHQSFNDRHRFDVSVEKRVGEKAVIRTQPFELIHMTLAEERKETYKYPKFNALEIFAEGPTEQSDQTSAQFYGAKVESELSLRRFALTPAYMNATDDGITDTQAEEAIKKANPEIEKSTSQQALLNFIDPLQFDMIDKAQNKNVPGVKITQENVSIADKAQSDGISYSEDIIFFTQTKSISQALQDAGYKGEDAKAIAEEIGAIEDAKTLEGGSILRLAIESHEDKEPQIVRASVYRSKEHILSVALDSDGHYKSSLEPEMTPSLMTTLEGNVLIQRIANNRLPTVYDAVYQAGLSYGLSEDMIKQLVKTIATDIDLQTKISINDTIDVFYPLPDKASDEDNRHILYIATNFNNTQQRYYRFQSGDGSVGYFDSQGRSSKQFLLRKPAPNARFTSPFGIRRHPVLGYVRMHTGVDWAAPRGSPIIAVGDGVVTFVGKRGGYGLHTEVKHANGYATSYSHQNGFAKGLKPGDRVKQGQVIGYVGNSGLSTGPHIHFEIIVNGTKVDPMRVRLPDNKVLKGQELITFKKDRDRIDALMNSQFSPRTATAQAKN